jgi:hypothetical protein
MKAYAIAAETIKDQAMFDSYRKDQGQSKGNSNQPEDCFSPLFP